MIRIIRTKALLALRTAASQPTTVAFNEAAKWHRMYLEQDEERAVAQARANRILRDLAQAQRDRDTARIELDAARRDFEETGALVRGLLEDLCAAAHDPDTHTALQGHLAVRFLRRALAADIARWDGPVFTTVLSRLLATPKVGEK